VIRIEFIKAVLWLWWSDPGGSVWQSNCRFLRKIDQRRIKSYTWR